MAAHNEVGKEGEELALAFLKKKGYRIAETNWRSGKHEIDIIAWDKDCLVIVEVKTRTAGSLLEPEIAVNRAKQQTLVRAANSYIMRNRIGADTRFDILSVHLSNGEHSINHIPGAFYPTLRM